MTVESLDTLVEDPHVGVDDTSYTTDAERGIPTTPAWDIYVLNAARQRVAQIDEFVRATVIPRFNSVGAWTLEVDDDNDKSLQAGWGVEFVRNGTTVLSGPVRSVRRALSRDRVIVNWAGTDWMQLLADRLIYPSASPFTGAAYDLQTDPAETLLHHYIKAQLGSTAASARRVAGLTFAADQARGATLSTAGRFQQLLVEMAKTARVGGDLGFQLVKDGTGLEFSVYQPVDRSAAVVFSRDLGNLIGYTHTVEAPGSSYVIVGGEGTGTTRAFVEGGSADETTWGRIESFVDQSSSADTDVLTNALNDKLDTDGERTHLSVEIDDDGPTTYGDDYQLGDIVTVVAGDTTVVDVVREVAITIDADGEEVRPKVRTPGDEDPSDPAIYSRLTDVEQRLLNLEVN